MLKISVYFAILRLLAFCLDLIDYYNSCLNNIIDSKKFNFLSLLVYVYYPTFVFGASFMRFDHFYASIVSIILMTKILRSLTFNLIYSFLES